MNGESALLWLNIISTPTRISIIIIGASHPAFLTFKKSHTSPSNDLFFDVISQTYILL